MKVSIVTSLFITACFALPAESQQVRARATGSLSSFIASESPIALQGILNNLGPSGSLAPGAAPGILVASPSTTNPNCTWAALLRVLRQSTTRARFSSFARISGDNYYPKANLPLSLMPIY